MTLATHSVVGVLVTNVLAPINPVLAIGGAFLSHFILDAIPHWDYKLDSVSRDESHPIALLFVKDKRFLKDLLKIGFDFGLGLVSSFLILNILNITLSPILLVGLLAAVIPDFFQFVYSHFRFAPLKVLQRFHVWIHSKYHLNDKPFLGVITQIGLVIFMLLTVFSF